MRENGQTLSLNEKINEKPLNRGEDKSLITAASNNNNFEMVELEIKSGANVNQENDYGYTALMFAASNGNLKMVEFLIENGANVNQVNAHGQTALILAEFKKIYGDSKDFNNKKCLFKSCKS